MTTRCEAKRVWCGFIDVKDIRRAIRHAILPGKWEIVRWHDDAAYCEFWCSRLQVRESIGKVIDTGHADTGTARGRNGQPSGEGGKSTTMGIDLPAENGRRRPILPGRRTPED